MRANQPMFGRPPSGAACVACLAGVMLMAAIFWGGVIWISQAFLPLLTN